MDKAKTLEVLRGMKFMQRKEEAKRRATFEVAQREEIERHLHIDDAAAGATSGGDTVRGGGARRGPARATVLYDDAFPASGYGLARRSFTDALGVPDMVAAQDATADGLGDGNGGLASSTAEAIGADVEYSNDDEEESGEDLWAEDDEGDAEGEEDPTAVPRRKKQAKQDGASSQQQQQRWTGGRSDGRFTVQSAVRAPKLPKRLEEAVAENERQRKRRRQEEEDADAFA